MKHRAHSLSSEAGQQEQRERRRQQVAQATRGGGKGGKATTEQMSGANVRIVASVSEERLLAFPRQRVS